MPCMVMPWYQFWRNNIGYKRESSSFSVSCQSSSFSDSSSYIVRSSSVFPVTCVQQLLILFNNRGWVYGARTLHLNGCKYTLNKRGHNGNTYTRNYNGCNVATPYTASAAAATVPTLPSLQTTLQLASLFVRICCICALIVCEYLVYMCLSRCCFTCLHLWAFVIGIWEHLQVVLWIPNVCVWFCF